MTIAITDYSFPSLDIEEGIVRPLGHEIAAWKVKKTAAELPPLVADADAIITQFAPVTAEVIASMQRAKVIVRYGIGVDNVDLEAAAARGVPVCNVPDYCIDEVADQTLAFLLATTRQVVTNCVRNRAGQWGLATSLDQMRALRDMTIGIVGFGRIGREVVSRLRAFKCRVLVHGLVVAAGEIQQAGGEPAALRELLSQSNSIGIVCKFLCCLR